MIKNNLKSKKNIKKLSLRRKISRLKKLIRNSDVKRSSSWEIREMNRRKLNLIKFPKIKNKIKNKENIKKIQENNKRVKFKAPAYIDYYRNKNLEVMGKFLSEINDCVARSCRRIFIDFSLTEYISAAAMLSFLADIDVLVKKSPHGINAISFSHPKKPKIESILKQVGFYDLLKKEKRKTQNFDDVTFWKYTSGSCSEPILAREMMIEIKKELELKASKKLYRGFVEAMSNSVEHAYLDDNEHSESDQTAKWWTFAGIKDNKLIVVICDKGVGIPATLPRTQGVSSLRQLLEQLGFSAHKVKDSTYIKAAASLTNTRTNKKYRGKGLTDIKSVIDTNGNGLLSIFSNRGRYIYKGQTGRIKEAFYDYKTSVCGTIIEWSIPCDVEVKNDENN
ncbi:ATP-binding protein [Yersinia enterocolitica]